MIKVEDMPADEMRALLQSMSFGHLGCARDNRPYVVPMHYTYEDGQIYFITTEGLKTDYIEQNPEVCFQVEDVRDAAHWRSVVVTGRAERLHTAEETEHAMQLITRRNPSLTPAISLTQTDAWGRANNVTIYRLRAQVMDGRQTSQ